MSTRITRAGEVFVVNAAGVERLAGWVDRGDTRGRLSRFWRAVLPGGRVTGGFSRRSDAVAWLVGGSTAASDMEGWRSCEDYYCFNPYHEHGTRGWAGVA